MMENSKVAIYIRLSDEDDNIDGTIKQESNSVSAQRLLIRDYMEWNAIPGKEAAQEYVER